VTNKEKLIEFILKLSNEKAEFVLNRLTSEKSPEKENMVAAKPKYHRVIYSIKHNVTGREYIGITQNFDERIKAHLSSLRHGRHIIEDMQADFDKYGEDYTISVIEKITEYDKRIREYELMKERKSYVRGNGYNYKDTIFKRKTAYATKWETDTFSAD
jgi:uncharacterized protein YeeX (DUF496 family)